VPERLWRILVLSDTHLGADSLGRMPPEVWRLAAEVDLVLHAGDVVHPAVLDRLAEQAEVVAVLGNNDVGLEARLPVTATVERGGARIAMVHDSGPAKGRGPRMARRFPEARVVVFGHSHDPLIEQVPDGPLLVNPGSPTHRRRQPVHTVAVLEVRAGLVHAELVEVGPLARLG
jgi:putative phosphoesterase